MNDDAVPDGGLRTALVPAGAADADRLSGCAGELIAQLAAHGAPGFEVDLLSAGQLVDAMAARRYDVVHIAGPSDDAPSVVRVAHTLGVPAVSICEGDVDDSAAATYVGCDAVLSASPAADTALIGL